MMIAPRYMYAREKKLFNSYSKKKIDDVGPYDLAHTSKRTARQTAEGEGEKGSTEA